jgi:hypothetical protein
VIRECNQDAYIFTLEGAGKGNLSVNRSQLEHFTRVLPCRNEQDISLYLPSMTAFVLQRED